MNGTFVSNGTFAVLESIIEDNLMIFVQLSGMCDHWNGQSQFELWGKQKVSFPTSWNNKICNYQHSQSRRITHDEKVAGARADMAADQDVPLQADHHQPGQHNDDEKQWWRHYQSPNGAFESSRILFRCPGWWICCGMVRSCPSNIITII